MIIQRNVARIGRIPLAVIDGDDLPGGRADLVRAERLAPYVEEITERVGPLDRGLDVDDAVGGVGVQPVEAGAAGDERALRGALGLSAGDPDGGRDLAGRPVDEDAQPGVDVEDGLLAGLAADPVDTLAGRRRGGAGQRRRSGGRRSPGPAE
jgi:hypothetical protein